MPYGIPNEYRRGWRNFLLTSNPFYICLSRFLSKHNDIYLSTCCRIMIKNFGSYRVDCPGGVRRNIFAKDTKHLSTLFMKRKHERNKHFQFSTGLYLQVLATRESNNNFRTNLVDRKESFAFIYPLGESNYRISHIRSNLFFFANINFRKNCKLPIWRNKQHSDPCKILSDGVPIS